MDSNNSTNSNSFTSKQKDYLLIIMSSVGLVSFCTCVLTVSLVFYLKHHKHFIYRLALYQVVSSMMISVDNMLVITLTSYFDDFSTLQNVMCLLTAVLKTYFVWINLLFTVILTLYFFFFAICLKDYKNLELFYVLFSVGFPLLFVWVPFIHNNYGQVGAFCWIRNQKQNGDNYKEGLIEQYMLLYGPCYLFLVISMFLAVVVVIMLSWRGCCHKKSIENNPLIGQARKKHKKAVFELAPLLAYPAFFFIFNLFVIGRRIYDYVSPTVDFKLALAHAFIMTSWGILSSIALLSHMAVLWYARRRMERKSSNRIGETNHEHTGEDNIDNYTSYAEVTTHARTQYLVPNESEVDKKFEDKTCLVQN